MLLENKLKALIQRRHNVSLTSCFFKQQSFSLIQDVLLCLPHYIDQSFIHILIIMVTVQIDRDVLGRLCRIKQNGTVTKMRGFFAAKENNTETKFFK